MINFVKCTVFRAGASKLATFPPVSVEWETFDSHTRKTVYFSKLIIEIKVVQNVISDKFYFDEYPVQSISKVPIF